jgi:putative ATP-dependent endonuclease of the OLD family
MPNEGTQVIITTHSTHISSVCKISSMNVLSKYSNFVKVFQPSNGLNDNQISRIERYLDAIRSNLLFAKAVLLVEGDAEQIIIPALIKVVFRITLDEMGVSIINIGSTGFQNLATIFHQDRINKFCSIITDLDKSIVDLPNDENDDDEYEKSCRNSQRKGFERKTILDRFIEDNEYVNVFYADNTFEVQFLQAGNSEIIMKIVNEEYVRRTDKLEIKEKVEDTDVSVFGKEVLRLAEKFGKGWFALLISEKLDHKCKVPDYILNALSFATKHLSINTIKTICAKRFNILLNDPEIDDETDYRALKRAITRVYTLEDIIAILMDKVPEDNLTKLLSA